MSKYEGHTPGPWGLQRSETGPCAVFNENGKWIALTMQTLLPNQDEANAKLIADAPMLLAQRDRAVDLLRQCLNCEFAVAEKSVIADVQGFLSEVEATK